MGEAETGIDYKHALGQWKTRLVKQGPVRD
jgi:hypothetical protein